MAGGRRATVEYVSTCALSSFSPSLHQQSKASIQSWRIVAPAEHVQPLQGDAAAVVLELASTGEDAFAKVSDECEVLSALQNIGSG